MARAADDQNDKALWLTLAQSWVRLAEHVARAAAAPANDDAQGAAEDGLAGFLGHGLVVRHRAAAALSPPGLLRVSNSRLDLQDNRMPEINLGAGRLAQLVERLLYTQNVGGSKSVTAHHQGRQWRISRSEIKDA